MPLSVHIVTHTHWDREWYLPVERFRQRLVALIDELLDNPPPPGESFLLDGQTIVIDDYLAVRPERVDELARLLREARLEAGPWYVLADELIPSGEALVRNLLAGRRRLDTIGVTSPPVLYCPDSFGHPAALPAVTSGFGLTLIVLWRGYGGARWPAGDTARWTAPTGDSAILFHLAPDGYELGSNLPADDSAARLRWQRMRDELVTRSTTGVILVPHGADHHARQIDHDAVIARLEQVGDSDGVRRSSLSSFASEIVSRGAGTDLPGVTGELRDSYGYTWTLQGTFGTRAHEKHLNAQAERLLLREAEPWSAMAGRMFGRSRRAFVESAWRTLLAAHPHDTLCGCSIDAVAEAMEGRLHSAANEAAGVRDDAIADLLGHDAAAAHRRRDEWKPVVVLRNPAPRVRAGVAIVDVREFIADAPVGPGSASAAPAPAGQRRSPQLAGAGRRQVLARAVVNDRIESPRHYPDNDLVASTTAAVWVEDVPAYGILCLPIVARSSSRTGPAAPVEVSRSADLYEMRNAHLAVRVNAGGKVTLEHRGSARSIERLLGIADETDAGDLYTPAPRDIASTARFLGARIVHRGPLRGELMLRWRLTPAGGAQRGAPSTLAVRLVLDADAPFVRVDASGENRSTDHRLRLAFATGVSSPVVWADAAFGAVRREQLVIPPADARAEHPPRTAPLHRYVSLFDAAQGTTIFSDGLAEYEATDDGTVLVTLVRAVGELSKNDLPERPGHAGWPTPTPGAQCLRPFAASFAVMPHGSRTPSTIDAIEHAADDVLVPLTGTTLRSALSVPDPIHGAQLEGEGLAFSALKESEDGEWLVARCVNLVERTIKGKWSFGFPLTEARLARLDETHIGPIGVEGAAIEFEAAPRAIVTILAR
jgi:hypothetical protein